MPPSHDDEPLYRRQIDRTLLLRLAGLAKPHRVRIAVAVFLLVALSVTELAFPLLMKTGIDRYIKEKDTDGLLGLSGIYLALLIAVFFLRYAQMTMTQGLGQRVMYELRARLFRHVQGLSVPYFNRNPVGRLMTRLTNDVEVVNQLFTSGIVSIFGDILIIIGIVSIMLFLDVRLALACFVVLPPLAWATFVFRSRVREAYTTIRVKVAAMNAFLQEHLIGMPLVHLFRRERASAEHFDRLNKDHRDAFIRSVRAHAVYFPTIELLETVAVALILSYGGTRVLDGALTLGLLVAFIQYSERFFRPIRDLGERYNILQGAMASSERIFDLLDTSPEIVEPASPQSPDAVSGEIKFTSVRFGYKPDEPVLHELSFNVAPGESVALVGHTGAGKTTIASLLVRFHDVWDGSVCVDELDIRDWNLSELRRHIAIVPQDLFLFSGSALRNIGLRNPSVTTERVHDAIEAVSASEFLNRLPEGLETELRERGNLISLGQKQLLSFARALAHDPKILILDEATSSVDTQTELQIRRAVRLLMKGRTSLVIAHRLSTIRYVDRILVLHKGRLVEEGTHEQLLTKRGIYAKLYDLEFKPQEEAEQAV